MIVSVVKDHRRYHESSNDYARWGNHTKVTGSRSVARSVDWRWFRNLASYTPLVFCSRKVPYGRIRLMASIHEWWVEVCDSRLILTRARKVDTYGWQRKSMEERVHASDSSPYPHGPYLKTTFSLNLHFLFWIPRFCSVFVQQQRSQLAVKAAYALSLARFFDSSANRGAVLRARIAGQPTYSRLLAMFHVARCGVRIVFTDIWLVRFNVWQVIS